METKILTLIDWLNTNKKQEFSEFGCILKNCNYCLDIDLSQLNTLDKLVSEYSHYLQGHAEIEIIQYIRNLAMWDKNLDKFLFRLIETIRNVYTLYNQYNGVFFDFKQIKFKLYVSQDISQTCCQQVLISSYIDYTEYYNYEHPASKQGTKIFEQLATYLNQKTAELKSYWLNINYIVEEAKNNEISDDYYLCIQELNGDNIGGSWFIHESQY